MFRPILLTFVCGLLAAQQPQQPQPQQDPAQPATIFRGGVEVVQAPVLVFDRDGNYVDGLQPHQFHLFDNGKEQNINVDVTYQPISLVICLQANAHVEGILPQVKKIGGLIAPLLIGEQGEAAVIAFDSRIRTLQDFTSDSDKITKAVKDLTAGSSSNRMIDAVGGGHAHAAHAAHQPAAHHPVHRRDARYFQRNAAARSADGSAVREYHVLPGGHVAPVFDVEREARSGPAGPAAARHASACLPECRPHRRRWRRPTASGAAAAPSSSR